MCRSQLLVGGPLFIPLPSLVIPPNRGLYNSLIYDSRYDMEFSGPLYPLTSLVRTLGNQVTK